MDMAKVKSALGRDALYEYSERDQLSPVATRSTAELEMKRDLEALLLELGEGLSA